MEQELFARHTAHADKLVSFGFIKKGKDFFYQETFHRGAFRAEITVHTDSSVTGRVIDTRTVPFCLPNPTALRVPWRQNIKNIPIILLANCRIMVCFGIPKTASGMG